MMRTWTDDEVATADMMNEQVRDLGNLALKRPGAVVRVANQYTQYSSSTLLPPFDTVEYDTDGMVDFVNAPGGLIIQTSGLYLVSLNYDLQTDASNLRRGTIFANILNNPDAECCRFQQKVDWSATNWIGSISTAKYLNAGDHITYQTYMAGSAVNCTFGQTTRIALSALWIGS